MGKGRGRGKALCPTQFAHRFALKQSQSVDSAGFALGRPYSAGGAHGVHSVDQLAWRPPSAGFMGGVPEATAFAGVPAIPGVQQLGAGMKSAGPISLACFLCGGYIRSHLQVSFVLASFAFIVVRCVQSAMCFFSLNNVSLLRFLPPFCHVW